MATGLAQHKRAVHQGQRNCWLDLGYHLSSLIPSLDRTGCLAASSSCSCSCSCCQVCLLQLLIAFVNWPVYRQHLTVQFSVVQKWMKFSKRGPTRPNRQVATVESVNQLIQSSIKRSQWLQAASLAEVNASSSRLEQIPNTKYNIQCLKNEILFVYLLQGNKYG